MPMRVPFAPLIAALLFACACGPDRKGSPATTAPADSVKLFTLLPAEQTNVHFSNNIPESEQINILTYEYLHNGGGVATGDLNNDGLADLYFTANLLPNRLFLNKGNLTFEEISEKAGVQGHPGWKTGAALADVNADGLLDIYVCFSGNVPPEGRSNQLFINNGDLTFTDRAAAYGLDDKGYGTQAAFLDYDRDGDLDVFVLNHNIVPLDNFNPAAMRKVRDPYVGDKLYRNDNGHFTDVSQPAGLTGNPMGYGLGIAVGDLDNDGWPDLYVSNDFLEHDYLYHNNGDGTFTEKLKASMKHVSQFSMGNDIADFNNDGLLDVMVLDMVAEDNYRQKTNMRGMDRRKFYYAVEDGFHYQYMINTLQLNNGNGTFSEVAQLAGVSNTDWSWAGLLTDFDNDGWKDLYVTNGYKKDVADKDYVNYEKKRLDQLKEEPGANPKAVVGELLAKIPSTKIKNYVYRNNGDLTFAKRTEAWGLDQPAFSNGASYADLDNDGDLDLVVSNIDEKAFVYRNNRAQLPGHHYLRLRLKGPAKNPFGVGARVVLTGPQGQQVQEHYPTRGFQSSVEPVVHFGLGNADRVQTLTVTWPDGNTQQLGNVGADRVLTLNYADARPAAAQPAAAPRLFADYTRQAGVDYRHRENAFDDFEKETLLPHRMSTFGPGLAVADVNGDGLEDFFVGGAKGFAAKLFLQRPGGTFAAAPSQPWTADKEAEDTGAAFFDADGNGAADLYVVSGGGEFAPDSPLLQDRLYLNDGKGNFRKAANALPVMLSSGSRVVPADYDRDGDVDLFVGGRLVPGKYPFPARSYLLQNDGGRFTDVTATVAPELAEAGMVTDAAWGDFDSDGRLDLTVVGEWMPVLLLRNAGGKFTSVTAKAGLGESSGWWFSVAAGDFDRDGDLDLVAGNLGRNYKYKASAKEPFEVYCSDFDENGALDIVLGYYNGGSLYPLRGRQCSSEQMPFIKEKFPDYKTFGLARLQEVYGEESLEKALHYQAKTFATSYFENRGDGTFAATAFPNAVQLSAINAILPGDYDGDGHADLLMAGNLYASEVETPRGDAGIGVFLRGNGKGQFRPVPSRQSGFYADGDVKDMRLIRLGTAGALGVLAARNNDSLQLIRVNGGGKGPAEKLAVR